MTSDEFKIISAFAAAFWVFYTTYLVIALGVKQSQLQSRIEELEKDR